MPDRGFEVRALAPTATAAKVLGDAIRAEGMTVAKMLTSDAAPCDGEKKPEVWVVDEASMMGARDAEALLAQAQAEGTRLVLVGDVAQLGSVEAGRSFGQLQDAGMATFKLEQIVRQSNHHTREAVEAMLAGDAEKAFAALDAGGGRIVEQPDTQRRSAPIPSMPAPSMSRSVAHDTARPSIPTTAPTSPKPSASATARRLARSTRR